MRRLVRPIRTLTAAAALCAIALPACGDEPKPTTAQPKPFLGVAAGAAIEPPRRLEREVGAMERNGVTSVRVPFYWRRVQPDRDAPLRFAETDRLVAAAARQRVALLPVVLGTPPWARRTPADNSPPGDPATYASFMRALVKRYGPGGDFWRQRGNLPRTPLRAWQIWNEPDRRKYWSERPFAPGYVALARRARKAIKGADPGAQVVMGGFAERSWETLSEVYRAGAKGVFDAAAIHPFTREPRNVLRIVGFARDSLRQGGDPRLPLWLTEVSWSSGQKPGRRPYPFETTEPDQAARLSEALSLLIRNRRKLGIGRIYWERWLSIERDPTDPFNFAGLRGLRPDGSVRDKPALAAYRRIALQARRNIR